MIIILTGAALNGKRFTFCQDEYILRTSCILEVIHMENMRKVQDTMFEIVLGIVGIIVTIISIVVTIISIRQSCGKQRHQKSNRRSPK